MLSLVLLIATAPPQVALSIRAGAAPGDLGVARDDDASPEGPGSIALDADGRFWVLDAVHRRVAVLDKQGALEASVPLPCDTIEDIALLPSGDLAVLDRLVHRRVFVLAQNGAVITSASTEGEHIDDSGLVTAMFADAAGVWLEVLHGVQVRVLDAALRGDAVRTTRPGLPMGGDFVRLRKVGDAAQVLWFDASGALAADGVVRFASLLELSGLVVEDRAMWVAGHELVQSAPGARPTRDAVVVVKVAHTADGRLVEVERRALGASPEFVPLKQLVGDGDGHVAHLFVDTTAKRGAAAVEVTSW